MVCKEAMFASGACVSSCAPFVGSLRACWQFSMGSWCGKLGCYTMGRGLNRSMEGQWVFGVGKQASLLGFGSTDFSETLAVRSRCWVNGIHYPVLKHGPRSLTYMRVFGWQTLMRNESDRWDLRIFFVKCTIGRPWSAGEWFECEHRRRDPKDGELCMTRVKPGETLVEARSAFNVQINRQSCV